jgi:hypothetical protein
MTMNPNLNGSRAWTEALKDGALSGTVASLATTAVLASRGRAELGDPASPLNGPSQWIWGQRAAHKRGFSFRHTVAGYVIHHASAMLWATMFESLLARRRMRRSAIETLALAGVTSAVACIVDYRVVRGRLTPGFEKRLSRKSLAFTYVTFALALAGAALVSRT